jgi:guanidinobutyrase / D-arginase
MSGEERTIVGPPAGRDQPRFAGFRTFAKLPRRQDVERCDIAVLGAPFDSASSFRPGGRFGPAAVREASMLLRVHNHALGVSPYAVAQVVDAGDAPASPVVPELGFAAIEAAAAELTREGARVVGIGGDHSVTLPLLRAADAARGPLGVVHFDAHTDTDDAAYGSRYTHGTVFRRAVEEELVDPRRAVQIGLRGTRFSDTALEQSAQLGYRQILAQGLDVEAAIATIREVVSGPTYVSIDIDVLDPAFGGLSSTPEIGGLTTRELLALLHGLAAPGIEIVAGDVVEVTPPYDPAGLGALAGANLAFELISLIALQR